jgi:hypothetical protein
VKRIFPITALFMWLAGTCLAAPPGYRLVEAAAASVNGEVIFLSDVDREACFYRCGAVAGLPPAELNFSEVSRKLISDTLVLQERKKLGVGGVDNAAVAAAAADIASRMKNCASPCAAAVTGKNARELAERRVLVRNFLERSVAVFIDVNDEEVRREIDARKRAGAAAENLELEKVRKDLYAEKAATEIRNWFARTTSKSRIVVSPPVEQ